MWWLSSAGKSPGSGKQVTVPSPAGTQDNSHLRGISVHLCMDWTVHDCMYSTEIHRAAPDLWNCFLLKPFKSYCFDFAHFYRCLFRLPFSRDVACLFCQHVCIFIISQWYMMVYFCYLLMQCVSVCEFIFSHIKIKWNSLAEKIVILIFPANKSSL